MSWALRLNPVLMARFVHTRDSRGSARSLEPPVISVHSAAAEECEIQSCWMMAGGDGRREGFSIGCHRCAGANLFFPVPPTASKQNSSFLCSLQPSAHFCPAPRHSRLPQTSPIVCLVFLPTATPYRPFECHKAALALKCISRYGGGRSLQMLTQF